MSDLPAIELLYAAARRRMAADGNTRQWGDSYPPKELILSDIARGENYVMAEGDTLIATFVLQAAPDPAYAIIDGAWLNARPYATIHRLASGEGVHGIFAGVLDYVRRQYDDIRVDTHTDNLRMQHLLLRHGFRYCGGILLDAKQHADNHTISDEFAPANPRYRRAYQWSRARLLRGE